MAHTRPSRRILTDNPTTAVVVIGLIAVAEVMAVVAAQGNTTTIDGWYALVRLVLAGFTLVVARWCGLGLAAQNKAGVRRGLLLGWPAYPIMALALFAGASAAGRFAGSAALGWFTLSMISVGIFEEVLFRGVLLDAIRRAVCGRTALRAALVSSVVFGLAHLVNLPRQGVGSTLVQIVYATLIGVFFAAVRIRSQSLIAVVVLHALLDWSFYLGSDVFEHAPGTQSAIGPAIVSVLVGLLLAAWGVRLLRRPSLVRP